MQFGNECAVKFLQYFKLAGVGDIEPPKIVGAIAPIKTSGLRLPPQLAKVGGVIVPLFQSEALWLQFNASEPHAVQVTYDKVNAVNANAPVNNKKLEATPKCQDYIVVPKQRLLTGVNRDLNLVQQFTALPNV